MAMGGRGVGGWVPPSLAQIHSPQTENLCSPSKAEGGKFFCKCIVEKFTKNEKKYF